MLLLDLFGMLAGWCFHFFRILKLFKPPTSNQMLFDVVPDIVLGWLGLGAVCCSV